MVFWKFTLANIKMYFRNKQALFWALFFPLLIMIIFGLMNFEGGANVRLGVINNSTSPLAQEFIDNAGKIDVLKITQDGDSQERQALDKGDRDAVLVLPENFMANPNAAETVNINLLANAGKPQQVGTAVSILNEVLSVTERQILQQPKIFNLETKTVNSRNLRYIDFLVPGIIAFSVMQLAIFSIVFAIVEYKEKGIMKRLFASPLKPVDFTLSQVAMRLVVTLMQVMVLILVAVLIFKIHIVGSYLLLAILVIMGCVLFLGIGFALAGIAKTQDAAAPIANIISFPQMFLAGVFFPMDTMPKWLQSIAQFFPLNYFADSVRRVTTEAAGWGDLKKDILGLAVWIAISMFLAFRFFNWKKLSE